MSVRAKARAVNVMVRARRTALGRFIARHQPQLLIVLIFVVSRFAFRQAGVARDGRPLNDAFQLLDRGHLQNDMLESLANLHVQPPLFNLFVGLGLQAPQSLELRFFRYTYLAFGLAMALALYAVLRRVGLGPKVGVALTAAFMLNPSVFLYENWLHYDYPVTLLLCLATLALLRYEDRHRPKDAAIFLVLLAAVVLTRSLFHLVWFGAWAVFMVFHRRHSDWRKVAAAAAVPLLIVVAVQANIYRVSGTLTSSTSLGGMSLAKMTVFQLSGSERQRLVAEGKLSALSLVDPFSPLSSYQGLAPAHERTGVGVLDEELKAVYFNPPSASAYRQNFNNLTYVDLSNRYLKDAVEVLRTRPGAYLKAVAVAYDIFFRPTSDFFTLYENRQRVGGLENLYNVGVYGVVSGGPGPSQFPDHRVKGYGHEPGRRAWLAIVAYPVAILWGAWALWSRRRLDHLRPPPLVLAFLWSTILYVMVVGNALEVGENNRFRLYTEPLMIVLLAGLVVSWLVGRRQASDGANETVAEPAAEPAAVST
ncbi:MAG: glycosyltransferase family 39 protein [Actinomycetota bacterium]|nr:glycosyltransferase family 39 protein [Actinomycetota bacterium]